MIYFDTTFNGDREVGDIIECKVINPADKALVMSGEQVRISTPVQRRAFMARPTDKLPGSIWRFEIMQVLK